MINGLFFVLQIAEGGEVNEVKVINLINTAGPVVKIVLLLLFFMSLISWVIIFSKLFKLRRSRTNEPSSNPELKTNPEAVAAELGVVELVERAMKKTMSSEVSRLEGSLIFLATTGTTPPFIGLFGTVWGIMTSFIGLASREGVPTLQAVAPGIAEALIATAIGLAAAIPAVVAYNYFVNRVRRISVEMENFSAEFLNIVERYLAKI